VGVLALAPAATVLPALVMWTLVFGILGVVAAVETRARLWGRPEGIGRPGWAVAAGSRDVPALRRLRRGA
jgi:hypothetical protein